MVGNTVTRAQLGEAVYQEVGLSRNESGELVEAVLLEISDALIRGETVKISSFGSFSVRQKGQRVGRNPKTGEEVPILPRKVLVFRASHVLKSRVDIASPQAAEDDAGDDMPGIVAEPTASPFSPGPGRGGDGGRF
jgi:integration host factor subunit alpha